MVKLQKIKVVLLILLLVIQISCKVNKKTEAAPILKEKFDLPKFSGIYIGHKRDQHVPEKFLKMDYVYGLSIGSYWQTLEPEDGKYNWQFLDKEINSAEKYSKKVNLRVFPGFFTPGWLLNKLETFTYIDDKKSHEAVYGTYGKEVKIPIPWDPVYQKYWFRFIEKLGERYADRESITIVNMMGANRLSAEMLLTSWKHAERDKKQWLKLGYTHEKIIVAWGKSIDQWAKAFPDKILSLNLAGRMVFQIGDDEGAMETIIENSANKYGNRLVLQNNALTGVQNKKRRDFALIKKWSEKVKAIGFQTHTPKHINDIKMTLQSGFDYNAVFFEIFRKHLLKNPDVMKWVNKKIKDKELQSSYP